VTDVLDDDRRLLAEPQKSKGTSFAAPDGAPERVLDESTACGRRDQSFIMSAIRRSISSRVTISTTGGRCRLRAGLRAAACARDGGGRSFSSLRWRLGVLQQLRDTAFKVRPRDVKPKKAAPARLLATVHFGSP
jgi:hypothetical protein